MAEAVFVAGWKFSGMYGRPPRGKGFLGASGGWSPVPPARGFHGIWPHSTCSSLLQRFFLQGHPHMARRPAPDRRHVGLGAGFVYEHQPERIEAVLTLLSSRPPARDVRMAVLADIHTLTSQPKLKILAFCAKLDWLVTQVTADMPSRFISGIISAEVARIAAEYNQRVTREDAALAGQLAGDVVEAFLLMNEERRSAASNLRGCIARELVAKLLNVELPPALRTKRRREPWYAEDWAGPVAGPTVIEREYGISRSTLYKWQRDGHVIALPKGRKKFAFPLRQFVDGRPVRRLKELSACFEDSRKAWVWLCAVHPKLNEAPLEHLRRGDERSVLLVMP